MKHTKNMFYNPTHESGELYLYATNNGELYRRQISAIENNLRRKMERGVYDHNKAVDAFYYATDAASRLYNSDFGYSFTVTERYTAAVDMADDFILENATPETVVNIHAVKIA